MVILKLLVDAGEPLHGYQIMRRLETNAVGGFTFKEGLIYPTLHRMEKEGLLRSSWEVSAAQRRRKVYSVTEKGRRLLEQELQEWREFSQGVNRLLGLEGASL